MTEKTEKDKEKTILNEPTESYQCRAKMQIVRLYIYIFKCMENKVLKV